MCGIVGYIGPDAAQPILLDGLSRLEYRGYDSAGIAVMHGGQIRLAKAKGRLENLRARLNTQPLEGCVGIGHTRWATHGEPSDLNAHPHTDMKGGIAVVHNGIIENHDKLRTMLCARGCVFVSETDTEVIAHLLCQLDEGDMRTTLRRAQALLEGSYALCVLTDREPDVLYCTRRDSPLVVGLGKKAQYVASDIPALITRTRQVELLADGEIAELRADGVKVYDAYLRERPLSPTHIDWNIESAEKGGYAHFMLKEIHEEPAALHKTFSAHTTADGTALAADVFPLSSGDVSGLTSVIMVACGTAYHAALIGVSAIEKLAGLPARAELASEFRYREPLIGPGTLCVAVSQSGETADTLAALREAARLGATTLSVTNTLGSSMARESGRNVLYTYAGPEISVASTKAYITQAELLILLAIDLAVKRGALPAAEASQLLHAMSTLPGQAESLLESATNVQRFASRYFDRKQAFFMGRGLDWALAQEASLKLKEVSYIVSEAYAAGEMKHGPIALIEQGTLVCALMTQPRLADKLLSNVREVKSRGARILMICTESLAEKARREADVLWSIPDTESLFAPLLAVIPAQLLAYAMAVSRGCDVDKPRNLAKSVTVE